MTMPTREEIMECLQEGSSSKQWILLRRVADALDGCVVVPISSMPVEKHPEDGCGDEDFYNRGWNACRSKMLVASANKENDRE
jgi:hypothetical protein